MSSVTVCLGVSHHTTPLSLRERLSYSPTQAQSALRRLVEESPEGAVDEAVLLHTCNRTEFYASGAEAGAALEAVADFLNRLHEISEADEADLASHAFALEREAAERHLMCVAAGLDSMVMGEYQILGQVREAARLAGTAGTIGPRLSELFASAVRAGRRARAETDIGRGAASVPSAAVALARQSARQVDQGVVVVVGAGKMGLLTAKGLREFGARRMLVSNRSYEKATALARTWDGCAVTFDELPRAVAEADVVISCTSAPHAVITCAMIEQAMAERPERPLTIVDIAVPRDVDPAARNLAGVSLYDLDDLQAHTLETALERSGAVPAVQAIVGAEVVALHAWEQRMDIEPTVRALHLWGDEVTAAELQTALRRLPDLDARGRDVVAALAAAIAGKLLHPPTAALRAQLGDREAARYAAVVRGMFALDEGAHLPTANGRFENGTAASQAPVDGGSAAH